ncbi:MAG: pyridoxal phosphate-dependent aminotransferase [Rhodospirillaceae bacterium]|nr:pyridoxal phosphate-dependent aminotransferase [Rhodospirillaceae bacterium]
MLDIAPAARSLGTETAFDVLARANALAAEGRSIVNLGIGQPDFRTADHIVEAAIKALRDGHHGYTPAPGIPPLRAAVAADLHRRLGLQVDPGRIVCVPGGKVTIWFACLALGHPGVEIVYPDPGFPIYRSAAAFTGATAVPMVLREEDGFAMTADGLAQVLSEKTRLVILNTPSNPLGAVTPADELGRIARLLADYPQAAILSDEIYGQMTYGGAEHVSLLSFPEIADRVIVLDGWSKTYAMTGWRLGYAVWPEELVEPAIRLCVNSHSCVNAATQWAGIAALEGPQDAVATMVAAFAERRRRVVDRLNALPGVHCPEPHGAFYAFPNVTGTGFDAGALQDRLLTEAGVALISGTSFGAAGQGYLRLSYAADLPALEEGIARMAAFLGKEASIGAP